MIDPELQAALDVLSAKIEATYQSTEKTRKYLLWTLIISVAVFVLPLIGIVFVAPSFLSSYAGTLQDVGGY